MADEVLCRQLGDELYSALVERRPVPPLSERGHDLVIEDSYRIQSRMIERMRDAGARPVGKKIGVTAKVVQDMMGVNQPDFGWLMSDMVLNDGDVIDTSRLIQPRAEGEIAFLLKKDLCGPGVTGADVLAATEGVMACFEIVDSRIQDWRIKIVDTIADNASCGLFVLGDRLADPRDVDLRHCGLVLEKNGAVVGTGAGAASLGSPVNAVAWLANMLGSFGVPLKAGEIVLSGSLATLIPVAPGDNLRCTVGGIGSCSVSFT